MKWLISRNGLMVGRGSPTKVKEKNNNITSSSNNSTMVQQASGGGGGAPRSWGRKVLPFRIAFIKKT